MTIADLTEKFIQARLTFDDVLRIVQDRKIVYAPDATMQAMLSDRQGRTLIIEPGIGWREDCGKYSLITNYSLLAPESPGPPESLSYIHPENRPSITYKIPVLSK